MSLGVKQHVFKTSILHPLEPKKGHVSHQEALDVAIIKLGAVLLVDQLGHSNDLLVVVKDGRAQDALGAKACLVVNLAVEAWVCVRVCDGQCLACGGDVASNACRGREAEGVAVGLVSKAALFRDLVGGRR